MNQFAVDGQLPAGLRLLHTEDLAYLTFDRPRQVLSSAVLNGGFCVAGGLLNLWVPADADSSLEEPDVTLQRVSDELPGAGVTVGMMTAASMKSLRPVGERIENESLHVVVKEAIAK